MKKGAAPHTATPFCNAECEIMNAEINCGGNGRKYRSNLCRKCC